MLTVQNLSYGFPQKDLYNDISFTLETGSHCAFIGTNGSGKTTLLNLLLRPEDYLYDGTIDRQEPCRIGYTSQFYQHSGDESVSVFDYIAAPFLKLQGEIDALCAEMEDSQDLDALLDTYQQALDAFDAIGGNDYESTILKKLNLISLMHHKDLPVSKLSGGEFKLIQLMKEMLVSPDLMIMDEPDVFLDFENLNALRHLINAHKGTLLVITHNRYLLNHCFDHILHLENEEIRSFEGRYLEYKLSLLEKKVELQELSQADTDEIQRNEEMIDRLREIATNCAESVWGRSLKARVTIQARLMARRVQEPFVYAKQPDIRFLAGPVDPEEVVLEVKDYSLTFGETILSDVNFQIKAGDKVAIIGSNGTGKTTLLRSIFQGEHPAFTVKEGISLSYLSQMQGEMLDESNTVLEECRNLGFEDSDDIALYLSTYGFEAEMLRQPIHKLSGGEQNMLQLAKLSATSCDFLLLDEPTSHLDTYAQTALETAIQNYTGAMLMVSHDFYFIANCMDYVIFLEQGTARRMSMRKFRQMMYAKHFTKEYLALDQQKKTLEADVEAALKRKDFEGAKVLCEQLSLLVEQL